MQLQQRIVETDRMTSSDTGATVMYSLRKRTAYMRKIIPLLALAVTAIAGRSAEASVTYSFTGVTSNNSTNIAIGESQLSLTVSDAGGGFVSFEFNNSGPEASSIADVYFDNSVDPGLFDTTISSIDNSDAGVSFTELASPGNLPGGNLIGFNATGGLTADADAPVSLNGVNPGESLGVTLELTSGQTFSDVTSALADSSLRVGIHVQAFADGGSESFVNGGGGSPPAVPEPTSMAIFGIGLAGFAAHRRKRRRNEVTNSTRIA
ncbi:MAG: hypothetical protein ACI93T_000051 [Porticoccaceae bacterium]|jgi:hypothetical protein